MKNGFLIFLVAPALCFISCGKRQNDHTARFRTLGAEETGIRFANQLQETEEFNIIEYLYYYNGGGVAAGDLDGDGLPDLYFTANQGPDRLYRNLGGMRFEDITESAGIGELSGWSTGVVMADVNGDGRLDIYVCQVGNYKMLKGRNRLFINQGVDQQGKLSFTEEAESYGLAFQGFSTQAAFFDYDRDGDLDCYLLNHSVHSTENYGSTELRKRPDPLAGDRLYRNDGSQFTDVTAQSGIYSSRIGFGLGVACGDFNDDGWVDLYISNDFHENDYLYYNQGNGTFREDAHESLGHTSTFSMGSDAADVNNDGRIDLLSLDMKPADELILKSSVGADPYNIYQFKLSFGYHYQYPRNMLQLNRGNLQGPYARFSEAGQLAGVAATDWSWSALFADYDNDGRKDLFISNGIWRRPNDLDYLRYISNQQIQQSASDLELASHMPEGKVRNFFFQQAGDLAFQEVSESWGLEETTSTNGAAYADLDGDGDLDLVLNNLNAPASILENQSRQIQPEMHYLRLQLQGEKGNFWGIGARVKIWTGDTIQTQELFPSRGFQSASEPVLSFGLGRSTQADRIQVRWPDGEIREWRNIPADQRLVLRREDPAALSVVAEVEQAPALFIALPEAAGLDFRHEENTFSDFDNDPLLPNMLSTQGPRMAHADVNGDGLVDVFFCGGRGQSGALFFQTGAGQLRRAPLRTDPAREEVDAVFFDPDGDGDADLYIVSGGGDNNQQSAVMTDQLWLNDGRGNFSQAAPEVFPPIFRDGSCAVPLDYDGDGAMDLFLGARSFPGFYGIPPQSFLLRNVSREAGRLQFEEVTERVAPDLLKLGMVTDACLMGKGPEQQLVVVGEWMPVTFFKPGAKSWEKTEISDSQGWWNRVQCADLNGDGQDDLVLGNLGLNSDLRASKQEPLELFVQDFDNNYKVDPILTYYRQGKRYTYASFDELTKQLVGLRKQYTNYRDFAASTFAEVFPVEMLEKAQHLQVYQLASSVAINQGEKGFELIPLPREAQLAPLYGLAVADLDRDGKLDLLAGGNFYDSRPALGRSDASFGHFLKGLGNGRFKSVEPTDSGLVLNGQVRDLLLLPSADGWLLLAARNKDLPQVFSVKKSGKAALPD